MGLFSYLNKKVKTKFTGIIELPFQNGKPGNLKEYDTLSVGVKFESTNLKAIQNTIEGFIKQGYYGVLKIPFINGVPGKTSGHRTIRAEDL